MLPHACDNAAQTLAEIPKRDLDEADNDIIDIVANKSSEHLSRWSRCWCPRRTVLVTKPSVTTVNYDEWRLSEQRNYRLGREVCDAGRLQQRRRSVCTVMDDDDDDDVMLSRCGLVAKRKWCLLSEQTSHDLFVPKFVDSESELVELSQNLTGVRFVRDSVYI